MAILSVVEVFDGRGGLIDSSGERGVTRSFRVRTDSGNVGSDEVLKASGIPQWGDPYLGTDGANLGMVVTGITARPEKSPTIWTVEVRYGNRLRDAVAISAGGGGAGGGTGSGGGTAGQSNVPGAGEGGGGVKGDGQPSTGSPTLIDNPLLEPIQVQYRTIKRQRILTKDRDGNPVVNSAGQPFDPPLEVEDSHYQITITRNQATYDRVALRLYLDAINDRTFLGFREKTLRLVDHTAVLKFKTIWYWECTYVFEEKHEGWHPVEVLDAGYMELNDLGDDWRRCLDPFGAPVSRPALLDGLGHQLAADEDPVYLEFTVYREVDFHKLGFK